jgi:HB1, ASXL, restriction endonuclease HTH domain
MSTESKDFDHYAIVLADLKAKRDQLDQAILAIESVRGSPITLQNGTPPSHSESSAAEGDYLGMSISEAAKKLLKSRRKQMNNTEILAALQAGGMAMTSKDPLNIIGAVITRRSKETGDIVKVGRGTWGLKEWYPNRSFNKPAKNNGELEAKLPSTENEPLLKPETDAQSE